MTALYITLGIFGFLMVLFIIMYNTLVRKRNNVNEAWSGISVQLKRRYDLIPNLIGAVKGYMQHEQQVFENVTKARTAAMQSNSIQEKGDTEQVLSESLKSLFAVSENYPDLKANQNFLSLQEEITDTENKIQASRSFYNSAVLSLNTSVESIPTNIVASIAKFEKREYFQLDENEKAKAQNPTSVNF
ncbi:hypothetical protein CVV38_03870 [Candidatus Peregrinibacteria bacterium HGW-Peregrinibacteria-1]|jgi:LemA protein|nr:MAG: hypothetical protein CVV38_03870 [Candidatus Peregrinibacteria bacterium HGW-Peregrinibacteria-1]